jgi:hypothetical protein
MRLACSGIRFSNPEQKVFALMRQSGAEYRKGCYENNDTTSIPFLDRLGAGG